MGYGDGTEDSGIVTRHSRDGGIDGIINQDRLGLDKVFIQAKRYKEGNNIDVRTFREFVGSINQTSRKGVLITTSDFTKDALEESKNVGTIKVVLINGNKLSELMYENNIGVYQNFNVVTKKVDSDFFSEDII